MNIILFVCLGVYIAGLEDSEFKKYRDSFHEITRHERSPPPPSKLSKLTTNHMRIARLANGIYLQKGLSDGSIGPDDIVAGMWNLKDRTALEQLGTIPIGNLTKSMNELDEALKKVPDGLKQVDVNSIKQKLKPLETVKAGIGSIQAAANYKDYPKFLTESGSLNELLGNDATQKCVDMIKAAEKALATTKKEDIDDIDKCLNAIPTQENHVWRLKDALNVYHQLNKENRVLKPLADGISLIREYLKNQADFASLGTEMSSAKSSLAGLKDLLALKDQEQTRKVIDSVLQFSTGLDGFSGKPIVIAFQETKSFNQLSDDLKDKWLATVVGDKKGLQKLVKELQPLIDVSKDFSAVGSSMTTLSAENLQSALKLSEKLLTRLEEIVAVSESIEKLLMIGGCPPKAQLTEPAEVKQLMDISSQMSQIDQPLLSLKDVVSKIDFDDKKADQVRTWTKNVQKHVRNNSIPIDQKEFTEMRTFLEAYAGQLKAAADVVNNHAALKAFKPVDEVKGKIEAAQKWIMETNLLDATKCNLQSTDTSSLAKLNDLTKSVEKIKKSNGVADVINAASEISKVLDGLKKLNRVTASTSSSKDLSLSFVAAKPASNLLDVAVGIHALHQMSQVHGSKADLQMVIGSEPTVKTAIPKVKDPNSQSSLTTTWNSFPPVSAALTDYSKKLDDLEAALKDAPEKSLADVGKAYKTAATIQFQGVIDLKPFSNSFQLFDAPDQGIKDVEKAFKSIENQISGDLKLTQASFSKLTKALGDLKKQIDSFFGKGSGAAGQQVQNTTAADEGGVMMTIIIVVGSVLFILALIGGVILFSCCYFKKHEYKPLKKYRMSKGSGKGPPEPEYKSGPEADDFTYAYCKLQDIRLKINKRDANNCTPLYNAVMNKDWTRVRELLDKGALVDVNCGKNLRTCLHELVLAKDLVHGLWFLKAGAFDSQPSANGDTVFTWSDTNGFHEMFAEFKDTHKNRRIVPQGYPRPWNILVVNPCLLTPYERRKIPLRIRNKITWGFNYNYKKHDLDKYTHIVMPTHYLANTHMVRLDDYDLFPYRCIASLANLVVESWITEMVKNPDVIDKDEEYYIEACNYDEYVGSGDSPYYNSPLLELKTDLHKGHPKLLTNTRITILETKDPKMSKLKSGWEEVIRLFGGTVCKVPEPDKGDNPQLPYQCGYNWYSNQHNTQNACWILRFDDSVINPIWRSDKEGYTLVPFKFLPICIAGNYILNATNDVVPLEYDEQSKSAIDKKSVAKKSAIGGNPNTTTGGATKSTTKSTETKTKTPDTKSKTDKQ